MYSKTGIFVSGRPTGQWEPSLPVAVTHLWPLPLTQIVVCWAVKRYRFHLIKTLNLILMVWELLEKMK